MARYCFYCGRELDDYEKCDCRGRSYVAGENVTGEPRSEKAQQSYSARQEHETSSSYQSAWQHREEAPPKKQQHKSPRRDYRRQGVRPARTFASFFSFFIRPADSMARELQPVWDRSHTLWMAASVALSGIHYMMLNRSLASVLQGKTAKLSTGEALLSWLSGSIFVALIMLLYTLTLWLLSRFLYRQAALPFLHALAAGKAAWKFLCFFLILALPSLFTSGAIYGLVLSLMGLVFAVIVHARQLASLTALDENRAWQLSYLSIVLFAGILSSVTAMVQMLNVVR